MSIYTVLSSWSEIRVDVFEKLIFWEFSLLFIVPAAPRPPFPVLFFFQAAHHRTSSREMPSNTLWSMSLLGSDSTMDETRRTFWI